MTGTLVVLVIVLMMQLLVWFVALAATFFLAKRNGQGVESMSWSLRHGFTATFFLPKRSKRGNK